MVASLQKQTESMDVRAIEVTIKAGDTVKDANGLNGVVDAGGVIFNAVDLPAAALVVGAEVRGIEDGLTIGVGQTVSGVDLAADAAAAAGVSIDFSAPLKLVYDGVTKPLYVKATGAAGEAVVLIRYVLRGSSEYNI